MRAPGLRLQILLLLGGLLVLTFVPLHLALATYTFVTLQRVDDEHARSLARALSTALLDVARGADADRVLALLREDADEMGVVAARVRAPGGADVTFGDAAVLAALTAPSASVREEPHPLHVPERRLIGVHVRGELEADVALDSERSASRGATLIRVFGLYAFLMASSLLTVAYFALTRLIVRPLDVLSQAAESVTLGSRHLAVPATRVRELGELGASLRRMTDRLLAEEEAQRRRVAEVERATAELAAAQSQLVRSERLASVGRLAAGLAHEIGNPIAAVMGLQDLLLEGELEPAEQRDFIKRMRADTERVHRTLRDLLQFARPARRPAGAAPAPGDVEAAVFDTAALVSHQPSLQRLELRIDVQPGIAAVSLATEQLEQVLLNLILNAADALEGRADGQISVVARESSDGAMIAVDDNGPGVPADVAEHMFEPFFTTKEVGKGTGLGLSICQSLVAAAGGSLSLEAKPEPGARFVIRLPPAQPRAESST